MYQAQVPPAGINTSREKQKIPEVPVMCETLDPPSHNTAILYCHSSSSLIDLLTRGLQAFCTHFRRKNYVFRRFRRENCVFSVFIFVKPPVVRECQNHNYMVMTDLNVANHSIMI